MTDQTWRQYVEVWCVTHGLAVESALPWLRQSRGYAAAREQYGKNASDRVLDGLLHKAAIEAELIKGI